MQHKLSKGMLLNQDGTLSEAGYHTELIKAYNKGQIKKSKLRIKEWDYFYIQTQKTGLGIVIADNGYMGLISLTFMDYEAQTLHTQSKTLPLTLGKLNLSCTSIDGQTVIHKKNTMFNLNYGKEKSHLKIYWENFEDNHPLEVDVELYDKPQDSMVLTVPFKDKPHHFYYNQKILGMRASGTIKHAGKNIKLDKNSLALMDFGRGVWPYKSTWYWGAAQGYDQTHKIALNIGHGFGDTKHASEDMFFYDGVAHKLSHGQFTYDLDDQGEIEVMKPWQYHTEDNRLKLTFTPLMQRQDHTKFAFLSSRQNQVFGHYNGEVTLDDEKVYEIKDLFGFVERFDNRW